MAHAPSLSRLFDQYRVFYRQPSDPAAAERFISERLGNGDSHIIVAVREAEQLGFTQLYPTFSSVGLGRAWILNDLFVRPEARRQGVARLLLRASEAHARDTGALLLSLETASDNASARALYESEGWVRDEVFCHYQKRL